MSPAQINQQRRLPLIKEIKQKSTTCQWMQLAVHMFSNSHAQMSSSSAIRQWSMFSTQTQCLHCSVPHTNNPACINPKHIMLAQSETSGIKKKSILSKNEDFVMFFSFPGNRSCLGWVYFQNGISPKAVQPEVIGV